MKTRWVATGTVAAFVGLSALLVLSRPLLRFHAIDRWLSEDPERRQILASPFEELTPRPSEGGFTVEVHGIAFETPTAPSSVEEPWEGLVAIRIDSVSIMCEDAGHHSYAHFLSRYEFDPAASLTLPEIAESLRHLYATTELTRAEFLDLKLKEQEAYERRMKVKGRSTRALRGAAIVEGPDHVALLLRGYHRRTPHARLFGERPRSGVSVLLNGDRCIQIVVIGDTYPEAEQVAERIARTVRPAPGP